ncbi:TPA: tail fiber assembly protein [Escherichia coli]|nr:tail fiber assembly protein [Escherichia coli]
MLQSGLTCFLSNSVMSLFSLFASEETLFSEHSLRRQASMTQAEKFPDPFCSRAMLICSIIWLGKRMLRVVVLRVQDAADLEIATEEEISLLEAWKKYRVLLNRVDTSTAQDIEWPALP